MGVPISPKIEDKWKDRLMAVVVPKPRVKPRLRKWPAILILCAFEAAGNVVNSHTLECSMLLERSFIV
jgi:hypothetical protein